MSEPDHPPSTSSRRDIVLDSDRTRSVRRAQRHSAIVRTLRIVLPVSALAIFAYYGATVLEVAGWSNPIARIEVPKVLPEHLTMNNPRYRGFTKDGGSYLLEAKSARQDFKTPSVVLLNEVSGIMTPVDKSNTRLSAKTGTYNTREESAVLNGNIRINADDGGWARLQTATIKAKQGIISSNLPVAVGNKSGTIRARTMTIRQKTKEITFTGAVHARLAPAEGVIGDIDRRGIVAITQLPGAAAAAAKAKAAAAAAAAAQPAAEPEAGGAIAKLFQGGDSGPIEITSNRLDVDDVKRTATFTGQVKVKRGNATLACPELRIAYDGSPSGGLAGGAPPAAAKPPGAPSDMKSSIKTIVAAGPVVITEGETTRVTGATALYDAVTSRATLDGGVTIDRTPATRITSAVAAFDTARDIATLDGNVVMTSGKDRRATGDHAEFHNTEQSGLLTGTVVVTQGSNVLKGRRLSIDRKAGKTQLTAAASDGGNGRIVAQFTPPAAKPGAKKPAASPSAALAGGLLSTASFRTDPNAPVAVAAERLDVDEKSSVAVFRGDVVADQGGMTMRSAELHAHYKGSAGITAAALEQPAGAEQPAAPPAQLTHIKAKGSVIVVSKGGQKATGDWADFDTTANTVTLGGDVVLTQGRNVVRGTRLDIDLTSGEAVIKSDAATIAQPEVAPEPGGGWKAVRQPGRPSAVFFPQDARGGAATAVGKPNSAPAAAANRTAPAASGWSATTGNGPRPAAEN